MRYTEKGREMGCTSRGAELTYSAYHLPSPYPARQPRKGDHLLIDESPSCRKLIAKKSQQIQ